MKITHTKKSGRRWTIAFETEDEMRAFNHMVQCGRFTVNSTCIYPTNVRNLRDQFISFCKNSENRLPA